MQDHLNVSVLASGIVNEITKEDIRHLMVPKREHRNNIVPTKIYLNRENKEFAQSFGINLSIFFDNCLKELVEYLKGYRARRGRDLNPRVPNGTRALQNCILISYSNERENFAKWLLNRISEETAKSYLNILDKTLRGKVITEPRQLSEILNSFEKRGQRNKFSKAVRNLLNYYIEYYGVDESLILPYRRVLPIEKHVVSEREFITDEDLIEAWQFWRENLDDDLLLVAKLLIFSGLRLRHILRMLETFDESRLYRFDNFARYKAIFVSRGNKRSFWAYMPLQVADEMRKIVISENTAKDVINFKTSSGRTVSAKTIREWHDNFMIRNRIEKMIRNFIQGRADKDVEAGHYADLTARADEEYSRIVDKFPILEVRG